MQQESRGKRMFQKLRRSLMAAVMGITLMTNAMVVCAEDLSDETVVMQEEDLSEDVAVMKEIEENIKEASPSSHKLGNLPSNSRRIYYIDVKKPGKLKLTVAGLAKKQKVEIRLSDVTHMSYAEATSAKPNAVFYFKKADTYEFEFDADSGNDAKITYTFESKSNQGGVSFAKAVTLKKGQKKSGIFGFETPYSKKQYYKLKITKEELVKLKFTKSESCSKTDTLQVVIYKSNDKENHIDAGHLFEDQKSGTFYIRNSKNRKTEPGTYYIVVSKVYQSSGFDYSLTWLNK